MLQELKAYDLPVDHGDFTATVEQFYLKSEADEVIAEKDEKIDELQKATYSAWSKVNAMYDELRHHKYKRCLWLARWCASRSASWCLDPADEQLHKSNFYDKWKKRWLELATKFKEAK